MDHQRMWPQDKMAEKVDDCIFCKIARGETDTEVLYQDDKVIVFTDIKPHAPRHYLVVPKEHLPHVKLLSSEHIALVEHMRDVGTRVLTEQGGDVNDCRCGFHLPPFLSVSHLHYHVMAPESQIGFLSKQIIFRKNSFAFVSVEWALEYLQNKL